MRLLLDAHISQRVAEGLRREGADAVAAIELGIEGLDDLPLWEAAIDAGRVIVSYDKEDFLPLFEHLWSSGVSHDGLILVSDRTIPSDNFGALIRALGAVVRSNPDLTNQVRYLQRT